MKTCVTRLQKSPPSVGDNLGIPHSNNSLQDLQAAPPGSPLLLSNCLLWIPPWGIALTTFHLPELYESCKLHELPKPHNSVSFSSLQSLTPQPGKKNHISSERTTVQWYCSVCQPLSVCLIKRITGTDLEKSDVLPNLEDI